MALKREREMQKRNVVEKDSPEIPNKLYGIEREREMQERNVAERER
jgi:hypothetical protein